MDFWVLHNGPPHVALWIIKRQTNLNSKLSTSAKLQKENSKEVVERGRGNALRRTAWFVVVLLSNALERKFILVRCWNLRPFAAQPAHHPHGRRPLERAYLAEHLAPPLGTNSEASLVLALKCLPRRLVELAHTHLIKQENTSSSPRCLVFYI